MSVQSMHLMAGLQARGYVGMSLCVLVLRSGVGAEGGMVSRGVGRAVGDGVGKGEGRRVRTGLRVGLSHITEQRAEVSGEGGG
jgi:hypothetical protein